MMRFLTAIFLLLLGGVAQAQFPSPTFQSGTFLGNITVGGAATFAGASVTGAANLQAGGSLVGTFTGATVLSNLRYGLTQFTIGSLPTALYIGDTVWVTDCLNGSQTIGSGTGCPYVADNNLAWHPVPNPSTLTVTVGGQGIFLGGATLNQGNGNRLQLATSSTPGINGQCAQFDTNLNIVPSGGGCGAGGGSGTVSSGLINQLGFYAAAGTTISGLATANNGVLVTSGGGVPSIATTLPSGLTIPTGTFSAAALTGSGTYVTLTGTGKLTTAASAAAGAGFNLVPGAAPTVPVNGDLWTTAGGVFARISGATQGPLITQASISASAPIVDTAGVFSCATCAVLVTGGTLTGTSPVTVSATGTIAINPLVGAAAFQADSATVVHNDTYELPIDTWPWSTGTLDSVTYYTGGTSTPSFTIALQINGSNVTGCNAISVSSASRTTSTCTAANAITIGQHPTLVISGTSGSPFSSLVQVNFHHSVP